MAQHPLPADERLGKLVDLVCRIAEAHPPMTPEVSALVQELRGPTQHEAKPAERHEAKADEDDKGKRR